MGGPQPTTTVDQQQRAITCIGDATVSTRVRDVLMAAGFDAATSDGLCEVVDVVTDAPVVLVFDRSSAGWLGKIARLLDEFPTLRPLDR